MGFSGNLPSGNLTWLWKSPFLIHKSSINRQFSMVGSGRDHVKLLESISGNLMWQRPIDYFPGEHHLQMRTSISLFCLPKGNPWFLVESP
jgi:hypothetical protein